MFGYMGLSSLFSGPWSLADIIFLVQVGIASLDSSVDDCRAVPLGYIEPVAKLRKMRHSEG